MDSLRARFSCIACGVLAVGLGLSVWSAALAQLAPTPRPRVDIASSGLVSKNALGRPCLDVETIARGRVVNRNLFDHVISIENRCIRPIKLQICLYRTERCTPVEVPALKRKDLVIGIGTGAEITRYVYSEQR